MAAPLCKITCYSDIMENTWGFSQDPSAACGQEAFLQLISQPKNSTSSIFNLLSSPLPFLVFTPFSPASPFRQISCFCCWELPLFLMSKSLCDLSWFLGGNKLANSGYETTTNLLCCCWLPGADFALIFAGSKPQLSDLSSGAEPLAI